MGQGGVRPPCESRLPRWTVVLKSEDQPLLLSRQSAVPLEDCSRNELEFDFWFSRAKARVDVAAFRHD